MKSQGRDPEAAIGLVIGGLGPFLVAGALVPLRDDMTHANVGLVFVVLVVLAAAFGGRWIGAAAAISSTLAFDFFFTRPYQSLTIDDADDIVTTLLLLAVGLIVGEIVVRANRVRVARERGRDEITRLHRVAEQVAGGADVPQVELSVERELMALMSLRDCRFERAPYESELPRLERNGALRAKVSRYAGGAFALPDEGVAVPVLSNGHEIGRLVLTPDPRVGVSLEEHVVAIVLADQLGAAIAADHRNHTNNGAST